jgi:hypothetical protein
MKLKNENFCNRFKLRGGRGEGEMTGSNLINVKYKYIQKCQYNYTTEVNCNPNMTFLQFYLISFSLKLCLIKFHIIFWNNHLCKHLSFSCIMNFLMKNKRHYHISGSCIPAWVVVMLSHCKLFPWLSFCLILARIREDFNSVTKWLYLGHWKGEK